MDIEFESNNKDIINKCLNIMSKPIRVTVDSNSASYLKNRNEMDNKIERELSESKIDDAAYYDKLEKEL